MAGAIPNGDPLQKAVEKAKEAFARLPNGDQIFQRCINSPLSIVQAVEEVQASQKRTKSARVFEGLQKYTAWLQNLSSVIDVAVQTQAGVTCPVWAPLKFVLQVVHDNSKASEEIARLLETLAGCIRKVQLFKELGLDATLQILLLELFTDIVDFSVKALGYFGRRGFKRVTSLVFKPYEHEFPAMRERIREHASDLRDAVIARELLYAKQAREDESSLRRKELKVQYEKWLRPSALKEVHDQRLQSKAQGTCQWIQQNQLFLDWRDLLPSTTSDKVLFICGTHGCGKSVLASAMTEQFKNESRRVLFFYFSSVDNNRQKSAHVARSFLAQLLKQSPDDQVRGLIARLKDEEEQPSSSDLWRTLKSAMKHEPTQTFLVLDGIDEASEQTEVLKYISDLLEEVPDAKCLMLARPQGFNALPPPIAEKKHLLTMDSALTQQDIETFITQELNSIAPIQHAGLQQMAFETLTKNSLGMFLWVRLMISDLEKACSTFELKRRLQTVPKSLEDAYRLLFSRMKERLDDRELRKTQVTVALIVAAHRPLHIEELTYAVALWMRSNSKATNVPLEAFLPFDAEKSILRNCGDIVSISGGTVHLNHASVKEFLCRDQGHWTSPEDKDLADFYVHVPEAHGLLASLCLDYMDLQDLGYPIKQPGTLVDLRKKHPFVEYASYSLFFHLDQSSKGYLGVLNGLKSIATSAHLISWIEHGALTWIENTFDETQTLKNYCEEVDLEKWPRLFDCDEELRNSVTAQLECEIVSRTRDLGGNDYRTAFLSHLGGVTPPQVQFLDCIYEIANHSFGQTESCQAIEGSSEAARLPPIQSFQETTSVFPDLTEHLRHGTIVPSGNIRMYLRLVQHISRISDSCEIIDPLALLFHHVLEHCLSLPIYLVLSICNFYNMLGKRDQVMRLCRKILPRVDGHGSGAEGLTYLLMGYQYEQMGNHIEASKCYKRTISTREHFWARQTSRIRISQVMVDLEERLGFLEGLLELDKKQYGTRAKATLETQYQLARTLGKLGRADDAMKAMKSAWKTGSGTRKLDNLAALEAGLKIGSLLQDTERYQEARTWLEQLCKKIGDPTKNNYKRYCEAHNELGCALKMLEGPDEPLYHFRKAYLTSKAFKFRRTSHYLSNTISVLIETRQYQQAPNRVALLFDQGDFGGNNDELHLGLLKSLVHILAKYGQDEEMRIIEQGFIAVAKELSKEDRSGSSTTCCSVVSTIEELSQSVAASKHRNIGAKEENSTGGEDNKSAEEQRDLKTRLHTIDELSLLYRSLIDDPLVVGDDSGAVHSLLEWWGDAGNDKRKENFFFAI